jgi:hypothetical protein
MVGKPRSLLNSLRILMGICSWLPISQPYSSKELLPEFCHPAQASSSSNTAAAITFKLCLWILTLS